ncbi:hypothetical protein BCR36DRAFT_367132 [Piromyces finnis]|uniref:Extracellular metalloproteinase n=1 Tax=Piromyces finnis TaxID=1754191 RepID=A0A1Y1VLF2_9FUNG|nr:hypothetical protein BCR36DRAFT_367132 [Piromyces finnis]|eukprot:ORX57936.1 hypothetical protein BCR36DRAFT_367132 [Piromyces finnis]
MTFFTIWDLMKRKEISKKIISEKVEWKMMPWSYANINECTKEQKKIDGICENIYPYTSTSRDGIPPIMILPKVSNLNNGLWVSSGVSNHVLIHEYTHGVSARLRGGPNYDCNMVSSSTDFAALDEGYSDFFSATLQFDKKKTLIETYLFKLTTLTI